MKKILIITGTRADYGKLKSIARILNNINSYEVIFFVTGMHLSKEHGFTIEEIKKDAFKTYYFDNNISSSTSINFSRTIEGISLYVKNHEPDLIIVHGDRPDALAGSIVGTLNNILVAHIEGGEISGTVDEMIRHSISKLSNYHFVANEKAKKRLIQLGEDEDSIEIIGSPDIDILLDNLDQNLDKVKSRYNIPFEKYAILIFHPITTEHEQSKLWIQTITDCLDEFDLNIICIQPNNDLGSDPITNRINLWSEKNKKIKVFPSLRFESFLILLKHAQFIIGNSSAGIREAPYYGTPTINLGDRQKNRSENNNIINCNILKDEINYAIKKALIQERECLYEFGDGNSDKKLLKVLNKESFWKKSPQKYFNDVL